MATARQWLVRGLMAVAIVIPLTIIGMYLINPFGVQSLDPRERVLGYGIYRMPSSSMSPTLTPGSIVFSNAGYYRNHLPARGDIVVFTPPHHPEQVWVKRIIGLPGETIATRDGEVSINGSVLAEPYVVDRDPAAYYPLETPAVSIAKDHYYLLGDNRDHSEDSRFWGTVPRSALRGKLLVE